MALVQIVHAVDSVLRAIEPKLAEFGFGEEALARQAMPPMVTWVPAPDSFEVGGEQHQRHPSQAQNVVAMRLAGCTAHIWGAVVPQTLEDYSACEDLLDKVVASLRAILPARDLIILGGAPADKTRAEYTAYGRAYILSFQVRTPIWQVAVQTGTPTKSTPVTSTSTAP